MAAEHDPEQEREDVVLANGDLLSERVEAVDLDEDDTCSTDEMRDLLDL